MEEAIFLTRFGSRVTIVHRRGSFRASKIMADRALKHPKIEVLWNTQVVEVKGNGAVEALVLRNLETGETGERRPTRCSSRSVTTRTRRSFAASSTSMRPVTFAPSTASRRTPRGLRGRRRV